VVAVHAGNTAAVPASVVEAIIRSPTNMAAADVAAVEGRGHLATGRPSCLLSAKLAVFNCSILYLHH